MYIYIYTYIRVCVCVRLFCEVNSQKSLAALPKTPSLRGQIPDAWHMVRYDLPPSMQRKLRQSAPELCATAALPAKVTAPLDQTTLAQNQGERFLLKQVPCADREARFWPKVQCARLRVQRSFIRRIWADYVYDRAHRWILDCELQFLAWLQALRAGRSVQKSRPWVSRTAAAPRPGPGLVPPGGFRRYRADAWHAFPAGA